MVKTSPPRFAFPLFASSRKLALSSAIFGFLCLAGIAVAQEAQIEPGSERPMFGVLPASLHSPRNTFEAASTPLETWNGSFTYKGTTYNYNMVGVAPTTNGSASVTTYIIPVKIVISNGADYDPSTIVSNGNTATQNTVASPIFASSVDFTSGGTSMGTTQYIDAFQRANFWGVTASPNNYHLLLAATLKPEQTLKPPKQYGTTGTVFGFKAGLVDINWFDSQAKSLLTSLGITPNTFAIFLTYDVYLTQRRSCCIGGYHSSTGSTTAPQSYAQASYVSVAGAFAQDVSALSHEVGDPLENNPNFGGFPYTVNGFTYNLQDLVTLPYFGAPSSTAVNDEFTFQGEALAVCQNGS